MQIDPSLVLEIVVIVGALVGFGWRYNIYVEKKIAFSRKEIDDRLLLAEAEIKQVRAECARREDIRRIEDGITGVNKRIDDLFFHFKHAAQ